MEHSTGTWRTAGTSKRVDGTWTAGEREPKQAAVRTPWVDGLDVVRAAMAKPR